MREREAQRVQRAVRLRPFGSRNGSHSFSQTRTGLDQSTNLYPTLDHPSFTPPPWQHPPSLVLSVLAIWWLLFMQDTAPVSGRSHVNLPLARIGCKCSLLCLYAHDASLAPPLPHTWYSSRIPHFAWVTYAVLGCISKRERRRKRE